MNLYLKEKLIRGVLSFKNQEIRKSNSRNNRKSDYFIRSCIYCPWFLLLHH